MSGRARVSIQTIRFQSQTHSPGVATLKWGTELKYTTHCTLTLTVKFQNKGGKLCVHKEEQEVNSNEMGVGKRKASQNSLEPTCQKHLGLFGQADGDLRKEVDSSTIRKSLSTQSFDSGAHSFVNLLNYSLNSSLL